MHVELKFVSLVCTHLRQHNCDDLMSILLSLEKELENSPWLTGKQVCKTYLFITLFLPFSNELRICVSVFEQPLIEFLADGLLLVIKLVDVSAPLMVYLKNGPLRLVLGNIGCGRVLRVFHLDVEHL
jgi:hypothetical protein